MPDLKRHPRDSVDRVSFFCEIRKKIMSTSIIYSLYLLYFYLHSPFFLFVWFKFCFLFIMMVIMVIWSIMMIIIVMRMLIMVLMMRVPVWLGSLMSLLSSSSCEMIACPLARRGSSGFSWSETMQTGSDLHIHLNIKKKSMKFLQLCANFCESFFLF